jgi:hypothetical protein
VLKHQICVGGGNKRLVGRQVVGQSVATPPVKLGKDIVEQ